MRAVVYGAIDALRSVDPWYVAAALALYVLGVSAAGLRWRLILAALGHRVPVADALLTYLAGIFVNNVTPASRLGGEACRIAAIGLRSRVPAAAATVSAVYDRLSEVPPVAGLMLCSIPALISVGVQVHDPLLAMPIAAGVAAVGYLAYRRFLHERTWWKSWRERVSAGALDRGTAALAVGWSSIVWVQDVIRLMTVAAAFGVTLTVSQACVLAVLTIVGGVVPTVGGLGAIEGGLVAGLMLFGVSAHTAAAITAVERTISYVFATSAGAAAFVLIGGRTLWNAVRSARDRLAAKP
jgi:uncharacterized membrane protein YbhN (UPF0104 family)